MISIVGLEFFYTQAPKRMKSFLMAIFLLSVSIGNQVTTFINNRIQIPEVEFVEETSPGADGKTGTLDDLSMVELEETDPDKKPTKMIESAVSASLASTAEKIIELYKNSSDEEKSFPFEAPFVLPTDPWGTPIRYELVTAGEVRIVSNGPDKTGGSQWDLGITLEPSGTGEEKGTWLYKEKEKLGLLDSQADPENPVKVTYTAGGGEKLEGAAYFWFFTKLMFITAVLFVPFSLLYKPRTYLQDDGDQENDDAPTPEALH